MYINYAHYPYDSEGNLWNNEDVDDDTSVLLFKTYEDYLDGNYDYEFVCTDIAHDLFTVKGASEGTQSLEYPIGLITLDELIYAGNSLDKGNYEDYLYNGDWYWTVTPVMGSTYSGGSVWMLREDGFVNYDEVTTSEQGLRPVINLVAGSLTSGDGTAGNPYRIS